MTIASIRQKLVEYLKTADDKKVKALYAIVEDEINTKENDWDNDFIQDLEKRSQSFADGTAKTYTWEETKLAARERI